VTIGVHVGFAVHCNRAGLSTTAQEGRLSNCCTTPMHAAPLHRPWLQLSTARSMSTCMSHGWPARVCLQYPSCSGCDAVVGAGWMGVNSWVPTAGNTLHSTLMQHVIQASAPHLPAAAAAAAAAAAVLHASSASHTPMHHWPCWRFSAIAAATAAVRQSWGTPVGS
jgi:hypothetical protein